MTPGPAHPSLAGRAGGPILLLLLAAAIAQTMAELVPMLLRDDAYSGDAQQHVWWLYRFIDPALFPNDLIATYYSLPAFSTPGYQVVMRALIGWIDPQHAAELLAIGLAVVAIVLTAVLGFGIGKKTGAAAALAVFILCQCERLLDGGYPRTFGLVLLLAGMIALHRRRWAALGAVLAVSPLFYAPTVLNLAPAAALVFAFDVYRSRRLPDGIVPFVLLGGVGVVIIGSIYLKPAPAEIGKWYTYNEGRKLAEMRPGGRTAFFRSWPTYYFKSPVSGIGLTPWQAGFAAAALLGLTIWRPATVPPAAWALLAGALLVYAAAHVLLFKLYLPGRYTSYALPVFAMMCMAGVAREIKKLVIKAADQHRAWPRRIITVSSCVFAVGCVVVAAGSARAAMRSPGYGGITAGSEDVLTFLRTLPTDTLIAAHPEDANPIPLRSRRSVLASTETSIAFHKGYYGTIRERLNATFDMLYTTDWPALDAMAAAHGVDVFVLDRTRLNVPDDRPYFRPFQTTNVARIAAGKTAGFAMLSPPPNRVLMESGDWAVLRVGRGKP